MQQETDTTANPITKPTPRKRKAPTPKNSTQTTIADTAQFQARVLPWLLECFGGEIASNREERNHRFLEEALELVQACGTTADEAHALVDYVYGRSVGEASQEVGGVMLTLAALCLANGLDMDAAGAIELERVWGKIDQIRRKQAAKPKDSPLPMALADRAHDASTQPVGRVTVENGVVSIKLVDDLPVGTELFAHTYDAQRVIFHLTKLLSLKHDQQARLLDNCNRGFAQRIELEQRIEEQAATIERLSRPGGDRTWAPLTNGLPDPEQHPRVLIFTDGTDFAGEQVFDVKAEDLDPLNFGDEEEQPEVCRAATHWAPRPAF